MRLGWPRFFFIGMSEGNECFFWCYGAADVAGWECNAWLDYRKHRELMVVFFDPDGTALSRNLAGEVLMWRWEASSFSSGFETLEVMSCSSVNTVHSAPQVSALKWRSGSESDDWGLLTYWNYWRISGVTVSRMWPKESVQWVTGFQEA